jgi:hypothetical protein
MRQYWYADDQPIFPADSINPETGKRYTLREILQLWPEYRNKYLAVKIHCNEDPEFPSDADY